MLGCRQGYLRRLEPSQKALTSSVYDKDRLIFLLTTTIL
jgi:hypothetical protein